MKLLKLIPVLMLIALFNTNAYGDDCDNIKGNIVGKLFCKAGRLDSDSSLTSSSSTSSETSAEKKDGIFSKIWKRPDWTKKKN